MKTIFGCLYFCFSAFYFVPCFAHSQKIYADNYNLPEPMALAWEQHVPYFAPRQAIELKNGNVVLAGDGQYGIVLVCVSSDGKLVWRNEFGGEGIDVFTQISEERNDELIITGRTQSKGMGGFDVYVIRINNAGEFISERTYGGPSSDVIWGMLPNDTGYLLYGRSHSQKSSGRSYIIQIDHQGNKMWENNLFGKVAVNAFNFDLSATLVLSTFCTGRRTCIQIFSSSNQIQPFIMLEELELGKISPNYSYIDTEGITIVSTTFDALLRVAKYGFDGKSIWSQEIPNNQPELQPILKNKSIEFIKMGADSKLLVLLHTSSDAKYVDNGSKRVFEPTYNHLIEIDGNGQISNLSDFGDGQVKLMVQGEIIGDNGFTTLSYEQSEKGVDDGKYSIVFEKKGVDDTGASISYKTVIRDGFSSSNFGNITSSTPVSNSVPANIILKQLSDNSCIVALVDRVEHGGIPPTYISRISNCM